MIKIKRFIFYDPLRFHPLTLEPLGYFVSLIECTGIKCPLLFDSLYFRPPMALNSAP